MLNLIRIHFAKHLTKNVLISVVDPATVYFHVKPYAHLCVTLWHICDDIAESLNTGQVLFF